jgi:hypothetical protein
MSRRCLVSILLTISLASACQTNSNVAPLPEPSPALKPVVTVLGLSPDRAKAAFDSPEVLTRMLEIRWPIATIQAYCTPERRHDDQYQNLVMEGIVWKRNLYNHTSSGFDKIAWYANTVNGRAKTFSLGVYRGREYWLLEIGSEASIQKAFTFPRP